MSCVSEIGLLPGGNSILRAIPPAGGRRARREAPRDGAPEAGNLTPVADWERWRRRVVVRVHAADYSD